MQIFIVSNNLKEELEAKELDFLELEYFLSENGFKCEMDIKEKVYLLVATKQESKEDNPTLENKRPFNDDRLNTLYNKAKELSLHDIGFMDKGKIIHLRISNNSFNYANNTNGLLKLMYDIYTLGKLSK